MNNLFLFVVAVFSVCFKIPSFVEGKKGNETSGNVKPISCDRIPELPKNETFCVCRMSDTGNLVDLRGLSWSQLDPEEERKNPRFVTKDEYEDWYVGWSPCTDFSLYANPLTPGSGCFGAAIGRFTNKTIDLCETEGYHDSSHFLVVSANPASATRLQINFRDPVKPGQPVLNVIKLVCDKKMATPEFQFAYRNEYGTNIFKLRSSKCCEGWEQPTSDTPGSDPRIMSGGVIAGISVSCVVGLLVVVALFVGISIYKKRRGYEPLNNQPHPQPQEHSNA